MGLISIPFDYMYLCMFIYVHEWGRCKEEGQRHRQVAYEM